MDSTFVRHRRLIPHIRQFVVVFIIIIILIIIIIISIISFMQGIYTYIPETNYVPSEYSVAAYSWCIYR